MIIPEFPLRIGNLYKDIDIDKSYKVDFYVQLKNNTNIFIEVKTDTSSRRKTQDKLSGAIPTIGMNEVIKGICKSIMLQPIKKSIVIY